jgi:hypothetical protein
MVRALDGGQLRSRGDLDAGWVARWWSPKPRRCGSRPTTSTTPSDQNGNVVERDGYDAWGKRPTSIRPRWPSANRRHICARPPRTPLPARAQNRSRGDGFHATRTQEFPASRRICSNMSGIRSKQHPRAPIKGARPLKFFLSLQNLDILLWSCECAQPGAVNLLYLQQISANDRLHPATIGPRHACARRSAPRARRGRLRLTRRRARAKTLSWSGRHACRGEAPGMVWLP